MSDSDLRAYYSGRKIFVTGSEGFIGSQLVDKLIDLGSEVFALILYNFKSDPGFLSHLKDHSKINIIFGDIRDPGSFSSVFDNKIDTVFHLASLIGIPYSYTAAHSYLDTNITGTLNLLNAVNVLRNRPKVIFVSSSEVYGTAQYTPIDEKHPLNPQSPYAATKASAEHIVRSYCYSHNIEAMIIRPFNTFGPRQSLRAVIPAVILQALTSDIIKVGNIETYRDFNYIDNTIYGLLLAGCSFKNINTVNIGSGEMKKVADVISLIGVLLGKRLRIEADPARQRTESSEVYKLHADIRKAEELLDYRPLVAFEQGLDNTVKWYYDRLSDYVSDKYHI